MQFQKNDLLKGKELIEVFNSVSPITKAKVLSEKLKKYMCIDKNDKIYIYNEKNITYKSQPFNADKFYTIVTEYLNACYEKMDSKFREKLIEKFEKFKEFTAYISKNLSNVAVSKYEHQLKTYLIDDQIEFDAYTWQLHFNNGYINLKTGKFKERTRGTDYVTYYIKRDYKASTGSQRKTIRHHINKIYKDKEDRECVLSFLSRCLIGKPQNDQDTLFLMGHGSSGKSFILLLTQQCLGEYVELFQSDIFEVGNSKRDKIFNEFSTKKWVLIAWVNEFSDKKINDSDFKNFCDGLLKVTKLYMDGSHAINLKCKLIATTNIMPNLQVNSGSARRFLAFTHQSLFVENPDEVDEEQLIFLKDKYLLDKIKDGDNLLNAWVDILVEKCVENYENKTPKLTQNFKETTSSVISTNDIIQDFIDANLLLTNDHINRVGKNDMKSEFDKMYPNKHLSVQQLISCLREKKIKYEAKFRCKNIQGCFTGVKIKNAMDETDLLQKENHRLHVENEQLKNEQCLFKQKESKPVKMKVPEVSDTKEDKSEEYSSSEAKDIIMKFD